MDFRRESSAGRCPPWDGSARGGGAAGHQAAAPGTRRASLQTWVPRMASVCPGSPADPHATAQVQVRVRANCSTVRSEMLARVTSATWIDPHNNGTYAIENQSLWNRLDISRVSGAAAPGRYTDRIAFTFADEGAGAVSDPSTPAATPACLLSGCSESQAHRFIQSTQPLALPRHPKANPDPNPKPEP